MNSLPGCALLLVLALASPARAGMAVSDTLTHTYLSQMLSQETEQKAQAIKNVEEALERNETLLKQYEAMKGHYDKAKGLANDILDVKSFLDETYTSILGRYQDISDLYENASDPGKALETIKALLDDAFIDPRSVSPEDWGKLIDKQFDLRQLGWKNVTEKADELLKSMGKRMSKVEDLSGQIDRTENLKESQDLTNRLLAEILLVLQEQLAMSSQYQQAMVLDKYEGVTKDSIQARQDKLQALQSDYSHYRLELQLVDQLGITDQDTGLDTVRKIMNQGI